MLVEVRWSLRGRSEGVTVALQSFLQIALSSAGGGSKNMVGESCLGISRKLSMHFLETPYFVHPNCCTRVF